MDQATALVVGGRGRDGFALQVLLQKVRDSKKVATHRGANDRHEHSITDVDQRPKGDQGFRVPVGPHANEAPARPNVVVLRMIDAKHDCPTIVLERRLQDVSNVDGTPLLSQREVGLFSGLVLDDALGCLLYTSPSPRD